MKQMIADLLSCTTTSDYAPTIAELIADDVEKEVAEHHISNGSYTMTEIRLAIGRVLTEKIRKVVEIKNIPEIVEACNNFDYYKIIEVFEKANFNDKSKLCGNFQDYINILPNFLLSKEMTKGIEPIAKGKYWLVFNNCDITNELCKELEIKGLWLLDDITKDMFEKEGIF